MEINIVTIVLGMVVSFTLPLLIVSCVLVCILWSRHGKTFSSDVESVSANSNMVIKQVGDPNILTVIKNLYTIIQRYKLQEQDNVKSSSLGLKKASSVASKLIRFGRIQDMEGLGRLTSHLTGVVIVLNPAIDQNRSEQETEETKPIKYLI